MKTWCEKSPLIGVMAALMTVAMSFALVPIAYEPHLTVLPGILLGPVYGFIAGLIFIILRWLMGDGAVTLIGINALLMGAEITVGYLLLPRNPQNAIRAGCTCRRV